MLWVGLAVAGIVVLAACGVKVVVALRGLGRELERARSRLSPSQDALRRELERVRDARR
jgi:hypothetical protein